MQNVFPNQTDSYVKFFDKERLKKERELIDSWDYEICHQYGIDCLFVSQKSKFPKMKLVPYKYDNKRKTPVQNDLFFHAYGEISKPEYNEPFQTQAYVQFTEDLFAINGFGLNTDLNTTLIFNKTSFALDGAMAMADIKTINKTFRFKIEVDASDKYVIINYNGKNIKFKARFNWQKKTSGLIEGELYEFSYDPENYVKPDVLNTFKRKYSASQFIETYKIFFDIKPNGINRLNGKTKLSGTCHANFVIKNPWKAYSDYIDKIAPSVGDLVLLNGIDDNIIKLELTEVESENKTAQGISPLLGSYSFKCIAKPYIADNNASVLHDPITAPTDINGKKLVIQTVLNHDASKIADNVSKYEKLYTDDNGFDFTEDDVYGGYDLEFPNGLNTPPNVPVKMKPDVIHTNDRPSYKWGEYYSRNDIEIRDEQTGKLIETYAPDTLYTYLKNLFDPKYTTFINALYDINLPLSYEMFTDISNWQQCIALNVDFWFNESLNEITAKKVKKDGVYETVKTISAYTEADRIIRQIIEDESLFNKFIDKNKSYIKFMNAAAYDGLSYKYKIPIIQSEISSTYIDILKDKKDAMPIDIDADNVYELSSFTELSIDRYIHNLDRKYNLRTDLYDIEQYNLGSKEFADVVKNYYPDYKKWKELNIKKMIGQLIPIYRFENANNSRLATNGKSLFYETSDISSNLYRSEITSLETELSSKISEPYNDETVPLSRKLNWLEGDAEGLYFNNAYGKRIRLCGKEKPDDDKMSHLNYENDFSSPEDSFILTFKKSKYYLTVQPDEKTGRFKLNLNQ